MKKQYYNRPEAEEIRINVEKIICDSDVPIGGGEGSTETPEEP